MQTLMTNLKHLFQSPPARVMLGLWLVSAVIVAAAGQGTWLLLITATNLFYLLLAWVSVHLSQPIPQENESRSDQGLAQLGAIGRPAGDHPGQRAEFLPPGAARAAVG